MDFKTNSKENGHKKDKQVDPDITMDEENLIDMIHEMQQIVNILANSLLRYLG